MSLDITKNNIYKNLLFGSLYITEGIHISIAWVLTPIYLLHCEFTPDIVTLYSGIIMLPWIFKFIFGYYVDSHSYYGKKKFIQFGGGLASFTLLLIPLINPVSSIHVFIFILFLGQIGIGFLDLSADAWAIHSTNEEERGKISGSMTIGLYLGLLVGSGVLTPLAETINFPTAYFIGGLIILSITCIVFFIREQIKKTKKQPIMNSLITELNQKKMFYFLLFFSLVALNSGIISLTLPLYMDSYLELNVALIGLISALASISRAIGAFVFGAISDQYGRNNVLICIMSAILILSGFLIFINNTQSLVVLYSILGFLTGGLFAVIFALSMDNTNPNIAAIQFGIFMGFLNLGELSGGTISGTLITQLDFNRVFLYAAWFMGPPLLLFFYLNKAFCKK